MTLLDFNKLEKIIEIPDEAKILLEKPEKQISFKITTRESKPLYFDGYAVIYNNARGPAKGGIRFSPTVTLEETRDLAERMVYKTALVGIPFGGGKSGVRIDRRDYTQAEVDSVIRGFVRRLKWELLNEYYIPAPDMGTGPHEMAVLYGETHKLESVTGKPPEVGGLYGRKEATGRGVATATEKAIKELLDKDSKNTTIAIQGFGNVGSWTARFLSDAGAKIVAVSDIDGGFSNPKGLNIRKMQGYGIKNKSLKGYNNGKEITNEELLEQEVDILIPAACENVITKDNANKIKAKVVVEAANGPTTKEADELLRKRGIEVIPDVLVNSGGVIASYVEWRQAKSGSLTKTEETYKIIDDLISECFTNVVKLSKEKRVTYKEMALGIAVSKIIKSMKARGWM